MIDIRCHAIDPVASSHSRGVAARCQLAAGHSGGHALMLARAGMRVVRRWTDAPTLVGKLDEHEAGQEALPWSRGLPAPAWTETAPSTATPVGGSREAQGTTGIASTTGTAGTIRAS